MHGLLLAVAGAAALAGVGLPPASHAVAGTFGAASRSPGGMSQLAQAAEARSDDIVPPVPRPIHRWPQETSVPVIVPPVPRPAVRPQRVAALSEPSPAPIAPTPQPAIRALIHDRNSEALIACLRPAARQLLDRIEREFGVMKIISTCRPGARIAGSARISKHASGEAVDFEAGARKSDVVRWLMAHHTAGGTMTYSDMSHIHVDVGHHFVALNAPSGR